MPGKLYLIPTPISTESFHTVPQYIAEAVRDTRLFFVEREKSARGFLKKLNPRIPLDECQIFSLNEHTPRGEIEKYSRMILQHNAGVISESGCPCVADPGSDLVLLAHERDIEVIPFAGPSSILMALMASGLNGQNFAFNGYLPKEREARRKKIREHRRRGWMRPRRWLR